MQRVETEIEEYNEDGLISSCKTSLCVEIENSVRNKAFYKKLTTFR
jgi:hypothetical protein